jgi:hypothetical protein
LIIGMRVTSLPFGYGYKLQVSRQVLRRDNVRVYAALRRGAITLCVGRVWSAFVVDLRARAVSNGDRSGEGGTLRGDQFSRRAQSK